MFVLVSMMNVKSQSTLCHSKTFIIYDYEHFNKQKQKNNNYEFSYSLDDKINTEDYSLLLSKQNLSFAKK
jgi:hypothetical protein